MEKLNDELPLGEIKLMLIITEEKSVKKFFTPLVLRLISVERE